MEMVFIPPMAGLGLGLHGLSMGLGLTSLAKPNEKHLTAMKRVFRYLKGIINMVLWMKHIAVRYHFIKGQVENEVVELYFVKTAYQLADIFTKALARERFEFLINRLDIKSITPEELKHLVESKEE
ncbi:hypothetical protein Tco_1084054 [Tanacetum coccineum]